MAFTTTDYNMNLGMLHSNVQPLKPAPDEEFRMWRDGQSLAKTNFIQLVVYHSPTGFEWGYPGSGPSDLALNVLAMCTDGKTAIRLHLRFRDVFITTMPYEGGNISVERVKEWIRQELEDEGDLYE